MDDQQTQEKGTFPVDKGEDSVINKGGDTVITCLSEKEPVKVGKSWIIPKSELDDCHICEY